jgi:tRNA A-37 threonylcarbamoyl transferase component Bud32
VDGQIAEMLGIETVGPYLERRGVISPGEPIQVVELGGGVSNVVLSVRTRDRGLVIKQSLAQLRVADEWLANRERIITEAEALQLANRLTPGAVPGVIDADPQALTLTMASAPQAWRNWKDCLLRGQAEPIVARGLGSVLATWHRETVDNTQVATAFGDIEAFEQLRVDPYYRTVMRRRPALAAAIGGYVDRMLRNRRCLVHGDYSPKNVLVGNERCWVLDFEVAHFGDPAFDLAFMLNHLMLKAMHRPQTAADYERCAHAFWGEYRAAVPADLVDETYVLGHVGCLMLARVDGKSPAEYLTEAEQGMARTVGELLLSGRAQVLAEAWVVVTRALHVR